MRTSQTEHQWARSGPSFLHVYFSRVQLSTGLGLAHVSLAIVGQLGGPKVRGRDLRLISESSRLLCCNARSELAPEKVFNGQARGRSVFIKATQQATQVKDVVTVVVLGTQKAAQVKARTEQATEHDFVND